MASGGRKPTTFVALAKTGAHHGSHHVVGHVIGAALTVILLSIGIGDPTAHERLEEASEVAARQTGGEDLARGFHAYAEAKKHLKQAIIDHAPETVQADPRSWLVGGASFVLLGGLVVALVRSPSRTHLARYLGWAIAEPALAAAFAALVLEWRALNAVRALGGSTWEGFAEEAKDVATDAGSALALPLGAGVVFFVLAIALHRRFARKREEDLGLTPAHVASHFFYVLALIPWLHYAAAVVVGGLVEGSSTGASVAPWVGTPFLYALLAVMFALGITLWRLARRDIRASFDSGPSGPRSG